MTCCAILSVFTALVGTNLIMDNLANLGSFQMKKALRGGETATDLFN